MRNDVVARVGSMCVRVDIARQQRFVEIDHLRTPGYRDAIRFAHRNAVLSDNHDTVSMVSGAIHRHNMRVGECNRAVGSTDSTEIHLPLHGWLVLVPSDSSTL